MSNDRNTDQGRQNPENNPPKAMDSKKDVEQSPDPKTDQDFPGYPHYPAREDIMDQRTGTQQVEVDVENLPSGRNATGVNQRFVKADDKNKPEDKGTPSNEDELGLTMGTEADVDDDDLEILNATNAEIGTPQNVSNEELSTDMDIPGSELDDENEIIGEEDEENNYYSLGGDRHESQEENPDSGPVRES